MWPNGLPKAPEPTTALSLWIIAERLPHVANDSAAILRKVVADVLTATTADYSTDPEDTWTHRALLTPDDGSRSAELSSNGYIFSVYIPELDVSAVVVDEDLDAVEEEETVRSLAVVARAYLAGGGRTEHRRGLLGSYSVLVVDVDGDSWTLQQALFTRLALNARTMVERLRRVVDPRRRP